jgi:NAD(P)-dependent dehydrogenase (short-subunit alcohol dehydrogenase family)
MAHALVVGGTRAIGRTVVDRLVVDGNEVSVLSRRPIDDPGEDVRSWQVDVANVELLVTTLRSVVADRGPVASAVLVQRFRGDGDAWTGELAVTLTATRTVIETLADGGFATTGASVVLVSSNASRLVADEQGPGYHAAKAGLRQLARYYAVTLGPHGVRVNCVSPGAVRKETAEQLEQLYGRVTPLGRMASPQDVADAVSLLCDDRARFVTGQDLAVDGGLSLLWQETLARRAAGLEDR